MKKEEFEKMFHRVRGRLLSDIELRVRGRTLYEAIMHAKPKEVKVISVDAVGKVTIDVTGYEKVAKDTFALAGEAYPPPISFEANHITVNLSAYRFADGFTMYVSIDKKRKLIVINSLNTYWIEEIK